MLMGVGLKTVKKVKFGLEIGFAQNVDESGKELKCKKWV